MREIVWRRGEAKWEKTLIVVGIVLCILLPVVALLGWGVIFGVLDEYDWAETEELHWKPQGVNYYAKGTHTDPVSGHTSELFSKTQYIGSWKRSAAWRASETVIVQGQWRCTDWSIAIWTPKEYWYTISWSDSLDGPWETISEPGNTQSMVTMSNPGKISFPQEWIGSNDWKPMYNYWFEIRGDYKNYIRVELNIRFSWWIYSETKTATDTCRMLNGIGEVYIDGPDLYEEGEQVTFTMNTGYSGKSTGEGENMGWTLTIYNPAGDAVEEFTDIPDNQYGVTRTWTVPVGAYNPSWSNIYTAKLYNAIIDYDSVYTFVIDEKEKAPSRPVISFSGGDKPGDRITVTLESTPNEETGAPIDYFKADVFYESGSYIIQGMTVDAVANKGTFTFTPNLGGVHVVASASAHDITGRPSGANTASIYIKHPYEEEGPAWWQEYWYVIAGIIGAAAIGGFLLIRQPPETIVLRRRDLEQREPRR